MTASKHTAADLVRPGGFIALAIYNRHWTAPLWKKIKIVYKGSPPVLQKVLVWSYIALSAVKLAATGTNPFRRQRGMNIYYDAVDWVGGSPYEYASRRETEEVLSRKSSTPVRFRPTQGFTGCNEFIFRQEP